jgi:hypothetical protein
LKGIITDRTDDAGVRPAIPGIDLDFLTGQQLPYDCPITCLCEGYL